MPTAVIAEVDDGQGEQIHVKPVGELEVVTAETVAQINPYWAALKEKGK